jgi:hypothetical protein
MAKRSGKPKARSKRRPAAAKGRRPATVLAGRLAQEDLVDGCDVEFLDQDATPDAALPAATGGVAGEGRRRAPARRG